MQSDPSVQSPVDVLLPVFNGAETIAESVESLLAQTYQNIRILVIDDGSTDDTAAILKTLAERDERVVVITTENAGIVAALNRGLAESTAPFIARQDADDISFPDRIEKQIAAFEQNPDVVAMSGSCIHINKEGVPTGTTYKVHIPVTADYTTYPSTEPYLLHPFLIVRREAFLAVNGYRHVVHSEDTDLYWRLREIGGLMNIDEAFGKMRLHAASISNASIVNGRIMAITSQLAAVSAKRRALGQPDLDFPAEARQEYKQAASLENLLKLVGRQLDAEEAAYVNIAASVSLLDMSLSRAYDLDDDDCRFIRHAYASMPSGRFRRRSTVSWAYRSALFRYLRRGSSHKLSALFSLRAAGRSILSRFA